VITAVEMTPANQHDGSHAGGWSTSNACVGASSGLTTTYGIGPVGRTVSWVAAAPSIGVESTIYSAGASNNPSPSANVSVFWSTSRSLPVQNQASAVAHHGRGIPAGVVDR
jgi:hypothetical protein